MVCSYTFAREWDKINGEMLQLAGQERCRQNVRLLETVKPEVLLGYPNRNPLAELQGFVGSRAGDHEQIGCRQLQGKPLVVSHAAVWCPDTGLTERC